MQSERERRFPGPRRGQLLFAVALLFFAVLLLSQPPYQTRWVARTDFFAQPRFWPAVGLIAMAVFGGLHLYLLPWRRFRRADGAEALKWASVVEFAVWFMGYVFAVPVIGYLPSTLIFVPLLARRLGHRSGRMMLASVLFGLATVIMCKSFLSVKSPGGMIYEYLPGAIRSFFILNF